jgi:hypothetical protein
MTVMRMYTPQTVLAFTVGVCLLSCPVIPAQVHADETESNHFNMDLATLIPVDSYFLLDANLIWKPRKGLEIMLAGQNLFNSSQLQYVSELITPPIKIERAVYGKVTWNS